MKKIYENNSNYDIKYCGGINTQYCSMCSFSVITHNSPYDILAVLCKLKSFQTGSSYCFSFPSNVVHFKQADIMVFITISCWSWRQDFTLFNSARKFGSHFCKWSDALPSLSSSVSILFLNGKVITAFALISTRPQQHTR